MFKKWLTSFILFFFTINTFAVNLLIIDGSYQGSCADKEAIFENARANAYSKLPGNKEEYEQISPWQEQSYRTSKDCQYDSSYVAAAFVKKIEDTEERYIETMGRYIHTEIDPNPDTRDFWELAQKDAFQKAKRYCNTDQDPQFLKIVNKRVYPYGFGLLFYDVWVDYKC